MSLFRKTIKPEETKKQADKPVAGVSMKELYSKPVAKLAADGQVVKTGFNRGYAVLLRPLVTEKATDLGKLNQYVFAIAKDANKISVAKAIQEIYGIKPVRVNISNQLGKVVQRGRIRGKRRDWKKAVVTLPEGQTINLYEGV